MDIANIVGSVLSGIAGGICVIVGQMLIRKDKFKEALYKEKLSEYKIVSEKLWKVYSVAREASVKAMVCTNDASKVLEALKDLQDCTLKSIVMSTNTIRKINNFCYKAHSSSSEWDQEGNYLRQAIDTIEELDELFKNAIDTLRDEIGTDAVSEDIYKTIKSKL